MDAVGCRFVAATLAVLLATQGSAAGNSHGDLYLSPHKNHPVVLFANESYAVTCHSKSGEQMTWMGPDKERIYDKGRIHVEAGKSHKLTLVFSSIEKKDKGTYTCSSRIEGKEMSVSFKLAVLMPIKFVDTPPVQEVRENVNALVRCEVQGDPEPKIKWEVNGTSVEDNPKYRVGGDGLFINSVTLDDRGIYQCQAYQLSEQITKMETQTILLKVLHGPKGKNETVTAYGYINGLKNLTCDAVAEPQPTFRWMKNNVTINTDDSMVIFNENYTSVLRLDIQNASLFGEYTCVASNDYGTQKKVIHLLEGNKPAVPTFSIKTHTDDAIELDITAPDDGELKILKYRIEYAPVLQESPVKWDDYHLVELEGAPFKIEGLMQDTKYDLRVAVWNAAGLSDYTNVQSVTTVSRESQQNTANSAFRIHFVNAPSYLLMASFVFQKMLPFLKEMYVL